MLFKPWYPKGSDVAMRFYSVENGEEYIGKVSGIVCVVAPSAHSKEQLTSRLKLNGFDVNNVSGIRDAAKQLSELGLLQAGQSSRNSHSESYSSNVHQFTGGRRQPAAPNYSANNYRHYSDNYRQSTAQELCEQANNLSIETAPFKDSTRKNALISIDSREPSNLHSLLRRTGLNISRELLDDGDIIIQDKRDPNRMLLIERKCITDAANSVFSSHLHDQAERYWMKKQEWAREGKELQVIWIFEGENNGSTMMYNTLEQIKQMDGVVNYLIAILNQHVAQTFSTQHTAYLISKFTQGFLEQSLYYPVKVGGIRVDRSKKERQGLAGNATESHSNHGVSRAKNGIAGMLACLPGINTKVASALEATGKPYAEIVNLSVNELLTINGIGQKTAVHFFELMNYKDTGQ